MFCHVMDHSSQQVELMVYDMHILTYIIQDIMSIVKNNLTPHDLITEQKKRIKIF